MSFRKGIVLFNQFLSSCCVVSLLFVVTLIWEIIFKFDDYIKNRILPFDRVKFGFKKLKASARQQKKTFCCCDVS